MTINIDALRMGDARVDQVGFSFVITFRGWIDSCDCSSCKAQRELFEYLRHMEAGIVVKPGGAHEPKAGH
jgi:hypothetical protein